MNFRNHPAISVEMPFPTNQFVQAVDRKQTSNLPGTLTFIS